MKVLNTLLSDKELKKKILFTILMLFLFRVLSFVPLPFVNRKILAEVSSTGILAYASAFTGGALGNYTLMATGISAYISASIIIQLLTYAVQPLHELQKSPGGDKVIKKLTIAVGIVMAFFISLGTTLTMSKMFNFLYKPVWYVFLMIAILHCLGTGIAIWIGETITQKGFGNGVSLLIFINIISGIPNMIMNTAKNVSAERLPWYNLSIALILMVIILFAIVASECSERRITLKYSKATARGATSFGSSQNFLPIKLNLTGVMPIIFASTMMQIISFIGKVANSNVAKFFEKYLSYGTIPYSILMAILIFIFSYLYSALIFNPKEIADNIQTNGGCIPGIRPGNPTSEYVAAINKNLTFIGALYLSLVALIPAIVFSMMNFDGLATTSMMIIVGVSLETCKKIKTEAQARTYNTF